MYDYNFYIRVPTRGRSKVESCCETGERNVDSELSDRAKLLLVLRHIGENGAIEHPTLAELDSGTEARCESVLRWFVSSRTKYASLRSLLRILKLR